jgi:glycosyltransferase involved in cell wall biosynthesis
MPKVSLIVPCYNEGQTIGLLLQAIYQQSCPRPALEVVIADGMSGDNTRQVIAEFAASHPDLAVRVVDNPKRIIPAALNTAIRAAAGEIIVRLDGHSMPYPDYVERILEALESGQWDMVGGVWDIQPGGGQNPPGWVSRSIAAAAAHPLGVGDARYRFTRTASEADTVPFGAYRRSLVEKIGYFNEDLLTNEDYEFNLRVRQSGGKIWLDPRIRSVYFARPNLPALARQYWRYGYWKGQMLRRNPGSLRWRQAVPPLFVAALVLLAVLGLFWSPARLLLALQAGMYALTLLGAGLASAVQKRDPGLLVGLPLAMAVMHTVWGTALLWSLGRKPA